MNTLAVHRWPGPTPAPQDGLFAILINTHQLRDTARLQIRQASREALAAVLGVPGADVSIAASAGTPPRVLLAGAESHIGISFSHEDGYALAAVNLHGGIGADIMRIRDIPDWEAVARDYLGPATAAALHGTVNRPLAFTQAWAQREAALKFHAHQLSEWQSGLSGTAISLDLSEFSLTGYLHIAGG